MLEEKTETLAMRVPVEQVQVKQKLQRLLDQWPHLRTYETARQIAQLDTQQLTITMTPKAAKVAASPRSVASFADVRDRQARCPTDGVSLACVVCAASGQVLRG